MWATTKPTKMTPVAAMTIFLPTVERGSIAGLLPAGSGPSGALRRRRHPARRRHLLRRERVVQRLLGHPALLQHQLVHAAARFQRLPGYRRRSLIADGRVEGGHDADGVLDELAAPLAVGLDALDAEVGERPGDVP